MMITNKVTDSLLNYLNTGDEIDRCYAAKTLGNLKIKAAIPALMERLGDEDIDVCIDAITALGKICDPSSLPVLLESLEKDPDAYVKLAITEALASFKNKDSVKMLLKLAADRPQEMDFDENSEWDNWWDLQQKAIIILGEMKIQEAFPILKNTLEDEFSQDIESVILNAMAKIGGEADDYLISLLNNPSSNSNTSKKSQRRAATALGFSDSKKTLDALGRALLSKSADTRENAIYALGQRKASQYIEAILMIFRQSSSANSSKVKRAALKVIQDLANDQQINKELNFDQIALLLKIELESEISSKLSVDDISLQIAVLSFFQHQNKVSPIFNRLSDNSKQLIRESLNSPDDKVIVQAIQLLGHSGDIQSVDAILAIAISESRSLWLRKEAILTLSDLLIHSADKLTCEINQTILLCLKDLIHNKDQIVRFATAQSLLNLSNHLDLDLNLNLDREMEIKTSNADELTPISILLATIQGEQLELKQQDKTSDNKDSACNSCAKNVACSSTTDTTNETLQSSLHSLQENEQEILEKFADKNIDESERLITANEDQSLHAPLSTLEAITMDNIESTRSKPVQTVEQKAHDFSTGPYITEDLPKEMDEFVSIMRKNFATAKKIVRRKIDSYSDARHICARLLADNTKSKHNELIVNILTECLNDDDPLLRQEATESLSQISLKNPQITGLSNSFGKLVTLLDSKSPDMRISCVRAISHSGNRAALSHLLDYLSDEDYLVKLEVIHGLNYILSNKAKLSDKQLEAYLVLDEVKNETIIDALFDCLDDSNYSVSMAAIEALIDLKQTHAIELFIDVALKDEGQSAKRISKLLKTLDAEQCTDLLLKRLGSVANSSSRRYVMEMLETVVA